jgi:hypothetical protein
MTAGVQAAHMVELDLIPADYRNKRVLMRTLRTAAIVCLVLVCSAGFFSGVLQNSAAGTRSEIQRLDATAMLVNQQRATIANLALRKEALESTALLLKGLTTETALEKLLRTVGDAGSGASVWFLEWRVERLGAVVASSPPGAEDWFVIERPGSARAVPTVRVQMAITGQAGDRSAVSAFVRGLQAEAGIVDVRVQRASRPQNEDLVEFDLLVVADSSSADD